MNLLPLATSGFKFVVFSPLRIWLSVFVCLNVRWFVCLSVCLSVITSEHIGKIKDFPLS